MKKTIQNTKKKAFTLMELIIVIVIIGALTAIAVGKLAGSDKGAKIASVKSDIKQAVSLINSDYSTTQEWDVETSLDKLRNSPDVSVALDGGTAGTADFILKGTVDVDSETCTIYYNNNTGQLDNDTDTTNAVDLSNICA